MKQNKFLTLTFKPYMLQSGQLRLPRDFVRDNGIKDAEKITLADRNGVKWPSYVVSVNEQTRFYMAKGWRSFVASSTLKPGEAFTLEFVRGEGTTPELKFCSKVRVKIEPASFDGPRGMVQASQAEEEETETRVQKRARTSVPNKCSADQGTENHKQPYQHCSMADQVGKVKQSIVDVLASVRQFRCELEIKEHNLEVSLQEIDSLSMI